MFYKTEFAVVAGRFPAGCCIIEAKNVMLFAKRNFTFYQSEISLFIVQALGKLSCAHYCPLVLTFDYCHIGYEVLKKSTRTFWGVVICPGNAQKGVKICCLGVSAKSGHMIYQSTRNFILITKKDSLMGEKIKPKRVTGV